MSCIIKLKVGNEYRIFDTEDQLKLFLSEHQDEIAEWEVKDPNDKTKTEKKQFLIVKNQNAAIAKVVNDANHEAFEATKEVLDKEEMDDFDRAKFKKESPTLSLSEVLKEFKAIDSQGNVSRLFPEFIVANYLNMLQLDLIIKELNQGRDGKITHELAINAISALNDENPLTKNQRLTVSELVNLLLDVSDQICNESESKKLSELAGNDVKMSEIWSKADFANQQNFDVMIRGEILHNILHIYIENIGKYRENRQALINKIKNDLIKSSNEKNLRKSFHEKYDNDDSMLLVDGYAANRIDEICDQYLDEDVLDAYINEVKNGITKIEDNFKGKQVMFLSEKRITAKLSDKIDGSDKMLVLGKPDLIVLVDGVPHIVDLKCSRKTYNEWSTAKKLKTEYQLGMYKRLLNRIGIDNSGAQTYILTLNVDDKGKINNSEFRGINQSSRTNRNLDQFFQNVDFENVLSKNEFAKIDEVFDRTIGVATNKGHKVLSVEAVKEKLRSHVHRKRDGKYIINYTIFDNDKGYDVQKKWDNIEEADIESTINTIANNVVNSRINSLESKYRTLNEDLSKWFASNGDFDLSNFSIVQGANGINIRRLDQIRAIFMRFANLQHCKVINSKELRKRNLIAIKSEAGIEIISCTEFGLDEAYDINDKKATLFKNINLAKDNYKKTVGNVAAFQALLVANQICKASNLPLMGITVLRLSAAEGMNMTVQAINDISNTLPIIGISNNLENRVADRLSVIINMLNGFVASDAPKAGNLDLKYRILNKEQFQRLDEKKQKWLKSQFSKNGCNDDTNISVRPDLTTREKIVMLEYIRDMFRANYAEYFRGTELKEINQQTQLMVEIEKALQVLRHQELISDKDISKFGLSGAMLTSTDNIPTQNAQLVRVILSNGLNYVRMRYVSDFLPIQRAYVKKLDNYIGSTPLARYTADNPIRRFDNLYRKENGVLKDLILKNPFDDNSDLSDEEKQYVKLALFVFNRMKYKWKTVADVNKAQLKEEDFRVPLSPATGLNKFRKAGEGGVDWMAFSTGVHNLKQSFEDMKSNALSTERIFTDQEEARKKHADEFNQIYHSMRETRENLNRREKLLSEREMNYFSTDLETIMDMYFIQDESEKKFNSEVIPQIRGILFVSQFNEIMTGKTQENFMEFMTKYTKNVIFGESVMSEEVQEYMKKLAPVRSAAFSIALGWNVMNVPREVLMGFFKNISIAFTGLYGEETFSIGDYLKAWGIVAADVPNFIMNVTKIEMLNELYGIANMSITEIPEQTTSNKTGIFATFSRWMSWALTAPDYWNRMTMFIAQMIHDGTWEAHTIEEDENGVKRLKYDITKDQRFDIFIKYRGRIESVPKFDKKKFLYQKALYEAIVAEFNSTENEQIEYTPGEMPTLPRAYTNRERESLKSLADVSFGYYDKETKAWFFKTAVGQIFKMFLAFMSAKKCQYWQSGSNVVARGHWVELTNTKGEKIYRVINDDNSVSNKLESELTEAEKEYAQPVIAWEGMYIEGILQSYGNLMKDLYGAVRGTIGVDRTDGFKKLYNEYLKKGHIRHSNIMQLWIDLFFGYLLIYLFRLMFLDDPEVSGVSYKGQIESMDGVSQSIYWLADNACRDFQILDNIQQGFFNWDITSFSILERAYKSFWKSAGDDDLNIAEGVLFGTVDSFGVLRPFRPWIKDLRTEVKENAVA